MNNTIKKASPYPLPKLQRFMDKFKNIFRRSDTMHSAERYITGLLSDIPYKNCGMMAEHIAGTNKQALQELITNSTWNQDELNRQRIALMVENATVGDGAIIFDDTGFPKKGVCSVGVARQYSGTLGKVGNCQIAISSQYTDGKYTWPINAKLYLPESWANDPERLAKAKVPEDVGFKTKVDIALDLLDEANRMGVKHNIVVADSFFGNNTVFLEGLETRGERYVVSVHKSFCVRFEHEIQTFTPPKKDPKKGGRPLTKSGALALPPQYEVQNLINKIPQDQWKVITWRDGTKGPLQKEYSFLRVRWATGNKLGSQGWLVFERPVQGEKGDVKFLFSNLPLETPEVQIIEYFHRRHSIERFYQDAKDELGLDQYEGRRWHGFHRHFTLVMLAYSFLTLQRRTKSSFCRQYEVVLDRATLQAPSFYDKAVFSPDTFCS